MTQSLHTFLSSAGHASLINKNNRWKIWLWNISRHSNQMYSQFHILILQLNHISLETFFFQQHLMDELHSVFRSFQSVLWSLWETWPWSSHKSLEYIYSNSQQYIVWVKMIDCSFMPKIIWILSKDHVPWRYFVNFLQLIYQNITFD